MFNLMTIDCLRHFILYDFCLVFAQDSVLLVWLSLLFIPPDTERQTSNFVDELGLVAIPIDVVVLDDTVSPMVSTPKTSVPTIARSLPVR